MGPSDRIDTIARRDGSWDRARRIGRGGHTFLTMMMMIVIIMLRQFCVCVLNIYVDKGKAVRMGQNGA